MLPLGVFILVLILLYYSILLLANNLTNIITSIKEKRALSPFLENVNKLLFSIQTDAIRNQSGLAAFIFALWNFFAPDFGDANGGVTLIGALIPACILFINALILSPSILSSLPFGPAKKHLNTLIKKIGPFAGWITLLVAILHLMLYPFPFF